MTAAKFMAIQEALQPDWFQCLSDGEAACEEVTSLKRTRKSVDRSLLFLDSCLRLQEKSEVGLPCQPLSQNLPSLPSMKTAFLLLLLLSSSHFALFLFLLIFIYFRGRAKETSSVYLCLFTPQMATTTRTFPAEARSLILHPGLPRNHELHCLPRHISRELHESRTATLEIGTLIRDANPAGSSLADCATVPGSHLSF